MSITVNPMPTTRASGTFKDTSQGYVAGALYPNAAARNYWRQGTIASSVTGLVYGGVAISATTQAAGSYPMAGAQNAQLAIATGLANFAGFVVWDQSAALIQVPGGPVPMGAAGQTVTFVEPGYGNCLALPISATNAAALQGVAQNTALSWDYTNEVVIPYTDSGANAGVIPGPAWNASESLNVARIIDIQIGNSWNVTVNEPVDGEGTWNQAGAVVVLQI